MTVLTSTALVDELRKQQSDAEREKIRRHFHGGDDTEIIGVRMKHIFDTARAFERMPLGEVGRLIDVPCYEARMAAVSVLDFKARRPTTTDDERRAMYELYMSRHDQLDTWDYIDRSAPRVVGWYLLHRSRAPLFDLAASTDIWRRRTAITAAFWLIRQGDLDDPLALAGILLHDREELVNKPVGTALREIGKVDASRLVAFLTGHAATMPRVTLRLATENLPSEQRRALLAGANR